MDLSARSLELNNLTCLGITFKRAFPGETTDRFLLTSSCACQECVSHKGHANVSRLFGQYNTLDIVKTSKFHGFRSSIL